MAQPLTYLRETASQTTGPYVHIGLAPGAAGFEIFKTELGTDIAGPNAVGSRIRVEGYVYDGAGAPLKDVLIEVWQANAAGVYPHPADPRAAEAEEGFRGWGRVTSDFDTGFYAFETVKPGPVQGRHARMMAPHLNLWIVARHQHRAQHPDVLRRRGRGELRRPRSESHRARRAAAHADRCAREARWRRGLSFRHPPAGTGRDRVLRHLRRRP
jgi:protocatechuate 3,4-dioxygenase alpha subunit